MSFQPVISVTIPTFNNVNEVDATVQSILNQDYDKNKINILFADFGSTDGTVEKVLKYRREWIGIFTLSDKRMGRTKIADTTGMWSLQGASGRPFLIWPGDVVYPNCFKTCASWFSRAEFQRLNISFIVGEADIMGADGIVVKQTPLFSKPCRLRGYTEDSFEYVRKGYKHTVFPFGLPYSAGKDKPSTLVNLDNCWSRFAYRGFSTNVLYINDVLGCVKIKDPQDETDELLFAFEQVLTILRMCGELPDSFVTNDLFESACRAQLAKYTLWRMFLLHGRQKHKEAEDCFILARIINPAVEQEACWQHAMNLIEHKDTAANLWLSEYFSKEEPTDKPKWSVGGMATYWSQRLRQHFSNEKTSRFYKP